MADLLFELVRALFLYLLKEAAFPGNKTIKRQLAIGITLTGFSGNTVL
jgi:hypothetical protein